MTDTNKRSPIVDLVTALGSDSAYRYGWQSNLAMMMIDEGVARNASNKAANGFLDRLCSDVVAMVDVGESTIPAGLVARLKAEDPLGLGEPGSFRRRLRDLLNGESMENASDTPDFVLARYLWESLEVFDRAVNARAQWYGTESFSDEVRLAKTGDDGPSTDPSNQVA